MAATDEKAAPNEKLESLKEWLKGVDADYERHAGAIFHICESPEELAYIEAADIVRSTLKLGAARRIISAAKAAHQQGDIDAMDVDDRKSQPLRMAEAAVRAEELRLEQMKVQLKMREQAFTAEKLAVSAIIRDLDLTFEELEKESQRSPSIHSSHTNGDAMHRIFRALNVKARVVEDFSSRGGPQYDWQSGLSEPEQAVQYTQFIQQQLSGSNLRCVPASHEFVIGKDTGRLSNVEILTRRSNERRIAYYISANRRMFCKPDVQFCLPSFGVAWNLFGEAKLAHTMVLPTGSGEERKTNVLRHVVSTQSQLGLVISAYNSFTSNHGVNLKELDDDGAFFVIDRDLNPFGFLTDLQAEHGAYILIFEKEEDVNMWLSMIEVSQATLFWVLRRLCGASSDECDAKGEMLWERVVARSSPFGGIVEVWDQTTLLQELRKFIGRNLLPN